MNSRSPTVRIIVIALIVLILDQWTKHIVETSLGFLEDKIVIDGFFRFVNWHNTGAAWSFFTGKNHLLAVVALAAIVVLFRFRHHFDAHTLLGQVSLGLIFGGIVGNLTDRLRVHYVIDFLRFYLQPRGGEEIGFPAFNIADSAICIGVGLIFILSLRNENAPPPGGQPATPATQS